jgi:hypothetical protein
MVSVSRGCDLAAKPDVGMADNVSDVDLIIRTAANRIADATIAVAAVAPSRGRPEAVQVDIPGRKPLSASNKAGRWCHKGAERKLAASMFARSIRAGAARDHPRSAPLHPIARKRLDDLLPWNWRRQADHHAAA